MVLSSDTPHDLWDWDGVSEPVLIDMEIDGVPVKALMQANRNGYFYVLDRTNGKFLYASTYCEQNWSAGLDENGRPTVLPGVSTSEEGTIRVCPGVLKAARTGPPPPIIRSRITSMSLRWNSAVPIIKGAFSM